MENFIIPKNYKALLGLKDTEKAIRQIKEFFQINLSLELNLIRVTAPLFVKSGTGINDNLNGVEEPVSFEIKSMNETAEIVQSLAKWKRMMLADYRFGINEGLYTDMNAIRPNEVLGNMHSLYVDQWDWELVIDDEDRTLAFLKKIVKKIYSVIHRTEKYICQQFPEIEPTLPEEIFFIHSEEIENQYPKLNPKERENIISKEKGAVFITGIGSNLKSGYPHDGRSPDYDDWSSTNEQGFKGLNGDIIVYNNILKKAFELSSMGIRVNKKALLKQLEISKCNDRKKLFFHKRLLNNELPLTIGGGIGQSRLCMLYLKKAHIGEIQASIWPKEMIEKCSKNKIFLL